MELSELWKIFLKCTQYGGAVVSLLLNSVLFLLILLRSPTSMGNYKYLMLYTVIFQLIYSILVVVTEPAILTHGSVFFVFRNFKDSMLNEDQSFFLLIVNCGFFGSSLAVFAIHFIYRYVVIDSKFTYISGRKLIYLFLTPVFYGILWTSICALFFHYDASTDRFAESIFLEAYDSSIQDISYVIVLFYSLDRDNVPQPNPRIFFAIGCLWCLTAFSLFCVLYCGIKCYLQLCQRIASAGTVSNVTRGLQQQLFVALVVQTLIPLILMYIPSVILYIFPMINVDVGLLGSLVPATAAIYPAIDPLPTMFIVKSFRDTLLCRTCTSKQQSVQTRLQPPGNQTTFSMSRRQVDPRRNNMF